MYVPGVQEGKTDDVGRISDATVDTANLALADFISDVITLDVFEGAVLLHSVGSPALAATTIGTLLLENRVATQRRRLRP
jgi:hypothetical protein